MTAIGHDLRTPITRLKLRAEFVEDEEQRGKLLADLAELEVMVEARDPVHAGVIAAALELHYVMRRV